MCIKHVFIIYLMFSVFNAFYSILSIMSCPRYKIFWFFCSSGQLFNKTTGVLASPMFFIHTAFPQQQLNLIAALWSKYSL